MDRYKTVVRDAIEKVYPGWSAPAKECVGRALADLIREHFPEPGRCGECQRVTAGKGKEEVFCDFKSRWLPDDCSCPRFERRPDAYEELAREYYDSRWKVMPTTRDEARAALAAFLRERVTVREGE